MNYLEGVLDPTDESPANIDRLRRWLDAVFRGFHDQRADDDGYELFQEINLADGVVPRGFWLPEGAFGAGPLPVATFSHFDKTLNVGGGRLLPARMITDITVSPAHRRRGLLRRMLEPVLADAATTGVPVAVLTASEATIYGRFGFGPATHRTGIAVDVRDGFRLDGPPDPGRVELVEPADHWELMRDNFARFHQTARGSVDRPHFYRAMLTGSYDFDSGGGKDRKSRLAVHLDADGRPDGHVLYKHQGWDDRPITVAVKDLVALDVPGYLALWRFLAGIDQVEQLTWNSAGPVDVLRWSLDDMARLRVKRHVEHVWVRVLDVPAALAARPWWAEGRVVLDVDDPQGHTSGRWSLEVTGGEATVARTGDEPDLRLRADTLGALYLGGIDVATLAAAARITGSDDAVARFAALADGGPPPFSATSW